MSLGKAVIKSSDLSQEMEEDALRVASDARQNFTFDKDIASKLKGHFDETYGRNWHCIVGKNYGRTAFKNYNETMSTYKVVIKNADMREDMMENAVRSSVCAIDKFDEDKDIAMYLKREFNSKYSRTWHCIVGKQFGSDISHEEHCFIYFFVGDRAILLFKSG